jgi:hypothetical protein
MAIASAVSVFILVFLVMFDTHTVAIHPAIAAPMKKKREFFSPVIKNANAIPGSDACATASPRRLCLRSTAHVPINPLISPKRSGV